MEDFIKEGLMMSKLKHQNLLGLIGFTVKDNVPFLLLQHMVNGDLKTYLETSNKVFSCKLHNV